MYCKSGKKSYCIKVTVFLSQNRSSAESAVRVIATFSFLFKSTANSYIRFVSFLSPLLLFCSEIFRRVSEWIRRLCGQLDFEHLQVVFQYQFHRRRSYTSVTVPAAVVRHTHHINYILAKYRLKVGVLASKLCIRFIIPSGKTLNK